MVALFSTNASRKGARVSSDAKYALNLKERFFFSAKFSWWPGRGKKSRRLKHWHSVSFCQWDPPTLTFLHCKQVSSWFTWQLLVVTIWCLHEAWNSILQHWEIDLNWTIFLSAFCLAKKVWLSLNKFAVVQWKLTNQSSREKPSLFFFFFFFQSVVQVLGWLPPTCRTSCPIWLSTLRETPGAAVATALRRSPLPGAGTWSETSPTTPTGTTTCWRPTWSTTTAAWRSCWRPCVTSAGRGVARRCCGPTRSVSRRTWASASASRAASAPRCSSSSRSRGWGSTRPQPGSDTASGGGLRTKGECEGVKKPVPGGEEMELRTHNIY